MSSSPLPPWPATAPAHGRVALRQVRDTDVALARELSTDPYVPQAGTLPPDASPAEALAWVRRQQRRHEEGAGFSFTMTESATGTPVGHCGLWLRNHPAGSASAGFAVAPSARGRGLAVDALVALTRFAWTVPGLERVVLYIEPWNLASLRTAEGAGYVRETLLPRHQPIGGEHRDVVLYATTRPPAGR